MDRRTALGCLLLWPAASPRAAPVMLEGRRFEERIELYGEPLLLNGTGLRAVAWIKGYAAGLYLTRRADSAQAVVAAPGPKRVRLQMLLDVSAAEFVQAFERGVHRNAPAAQHALLRERMDRFEALIRGVGKARKGDVYDLDYDPARGMVLGVNGTLRGDPVPGADLYGALLLAFVGDHPFDERLRAGLLGRGS
jgi:hypothetical protein